MTVKIENPLPYTLVGYVCGGIGVSISSNVDLVTAAASTIVGAAVLAATWTAGRYLALKTVKNVPDEKWMQHGRCPQCKAQDTLQTTMQHAAGLFVECTACLELFDVRFTPDQPVPTILRLGKKDDCHNGNMGFSGPNIRDKK